MDVSQVPKLISKLTPRSPVVMLLGSTGIGKTETVAQGAKLANRTLAAIPTLSTMLPEDAGGIPIPNINTMTVQMMPPHYWDIGDNAIIFLDELNLARQDTLSALASVLWPLADGTRRVGSKGIPEDAIVICAGMPPTPGSPARPLPHFLRSRLRIISVSASSASWVHWANVNSVHTAIIAFIYRNPDKLAPAPPDTQEIVAFPTPRAWAQLSYALINEGLDAELESETITGLVGPGAAHEFITFRNHLDILPDPAKVLSGKESFPSEPSAAVATAAAVVQYIIANPNSGVSDAYFKNSMKWPAEYVVGLQFPAIQAQTPLWRRQYGFNLEDVSIRYPDWVSKYVTLLNNA